MAKTIEELQILISAKTAGLNKQMEQVRNKMAGVEKNINKNTQSIRESVSKSLDSKNVTEFNESLKGTQKAVEGITRNGIETHGSVIQLQQLEAELENVNGRIEMHRQKLINLKKSYDLETDRSGRKSVIQEEMLKTEAAMLRLTKTSDETRKKIDKLEDSMNEVGDTTKNTGDQMNEAGKAANGLGNRMQQMSSSFYAAVRRIARQVIVFAVIYKAIRSLQNYISSAMRTSDEFTTALRAVRTNLLVAFAPIFGSVNSALTWFMQKLATAIQYVAAFMAGLFGMTYKEAVNSARGLHEARKAMDDYGKSVKEAHKHIMGFDELNVMQNPPDTPDAPNPNIGGVGVDFDAALANRNIEALEKVERLGQKIRSAWEKIEPVITWVRSNVLEPFFGWLWKELEEGYEFWEETLRDITKDHDTAGEKAKAIWEWAWGETKSIAKRIWKKIENDWKEAIEKIPERWNNKMKELREFSRATADSIRRNWDEFWKLFKQNVIDRIGENFKRMLDKKVSDVKKRHEEMKRLWNNFNDWVKKNVIDRTSDFFTNLWNRKVDEVKQRHNDLKAEWNNFTTWTKTNVTDRLTNYFKDLWNRKRVDLSNSVNNARTTLNNFKNWIKNNVTEPVGSFFNTTWGKVQGYTTRGYNNMVNTWIKARNWFKNTVTDPIANLFKNVFNRIADNFNKTLGDFKVSVPNWVPGTMGGKTFSFPKIPKLAQGGIIDQPTLAMVGEAGKEAVMPLENNTGWIDQLAGKIAGIIGSSGGGAVAGGDITIPVYLGTDLIEETIVRAIDRQRIKSNGRGYL